MGGGGGKRKARKASKRGGGKTASKRGKGKNRGVAVSGEVASSSDANPLLAAYEMEDWLRECTNRIVRHNGPAFPNLMRIW